MSAAVQEVTERLRQLAPVELSIADDTHLHRHHAEGGSGAHLRLHIVSEKFEGLPPVRRHRLVYECVGSLPDLGLHALAISAQTPAEAAARTAKQEARENGRG